MQRVNQAYESQDLLGLFALQLEIEQIDPEHLAQASTERLRHYNHVLAAQLDELLDEIEARCDAFSIEYGTEPWIKLNPNRLDKVLADQLRDIGQALNQVAGDLKQLETPAGVQRWVKRERQHHQLDDEDDGFLPFWCDHRSALWLALAQSIGLAMSGYRSG